MLHPFTLSPAAQARADKWLDLIDASIALADECRCNASRLRDLRRKLVAHTTDDGLLAMWLGGYAEALRSEFATVRAAHERHAEKAAQAARNHAAASAKAAREHRAAAKKAARDYAAMAREARA